MDKQFIKALRETVREELIQQNDVEITGLGLFKAVHEEQRESKNDDGVVVMLPPKDRIVFTPDKKDKG
jgi:nucleoid DNA-binding protein